MDSSESGSTLEELETITLTDLFEPPSFTLPTAEQTCPPLPQSPSSSTIPPPPPPPPALPSSTASASGPSLGSEQEPQSSHPENEIDVIDCFMRLGNKHYRIKNVSSREKAPKAKASTPPPPTSLDEHLAYAASLKEKPKMVDYVDPKTLPLIPESFRIPKPHRQGQLNKIGRHLEKLTITSNTHENINRPLTNDFKNKVMPQVVIIGGNNERHLTFVPKNIKKQILFVGISRDTKFETHEEYPRPNGDTYQAKFCAAVHLLKNFDPKTPKVLIVGGLEIMFADNMNKCNVDPAYMIDNFVKLTILLKDTVTYLRHQNTKILLLTPLAIGGPEQSNQFKVLTTHLLRTISMSTWWSAPPSLHFYVGVMNGSALLQNLLSQARDQFQKKSVNPRKKLTKLNEANLLYHDAHITQDGTVTHGKLRETPLFILAQNFYHSLLNLPPNFTERWEQARNNLKDWQQAAIPLSNLELGKTLLSGPFTPPPNMTHTANAEMSSFNADVHNDWNDHTQVSTTRKRKHTEHMANTDHTLRPSKYPPPLMGTSSSNSHVSDLPQLTNRINHSHQKKGTPSAARPRKY